MTRNIVEIQTAADSALTEQLQQTEFLLFENAEAFSFSDNWSETDFLRVFDENQLSWHEQTFPTEGNWIYAAAEGSTATDIPANDLPEAGEVGIDEGGGKSKVGIISAAGIGLAVLAAAAAAGGGGSDSSDSGNTVNALTDETTSIDSASTSASSTANTANSTGSNTSTTQTSATSNSSNTTSNSTDNTDTTSTNNTDTTSTNNTDTTSTDNTDTTSTDNTDTTSTNNTDTTSTDNTDTTSTNNTDTTSTNNTDTTSTNNTDTTSTNNTDTTSTDNTDTTSTNNTDTTSTNNTDTTSTNNTDTTSTNNTDTTSTNNTDTTSTDNTDTTSTNNTDTTSTNNTDTTSTNNTDTTSTNNTDTTSTNNTDTTSTDNTDTTSTDNTDTTSTNNTDTTSTNNTDTTSTNNTDTTSTNNTDTTSTNNTDTTSTDNTDTTSTNNTDTTSTNNTDTTSTNNTDTTSTNNTDTTSTNNTDTTSTNNTDTSTSSATNTKEVGLTLDIAKHFYTAEVIKSYIDTLSASGGTYLQLHLSDDENYALESTVLNQLTSNAVLNSDGSYTNPLTGEKFLSFSQVADIAAYAKQKGIELVPEVDTPNHMDAIFTLLEAYKGSDYVNSIKSTVVNDEINITSDTSLTWLKGLLTEVTDMFGDSSEHFHIGGDEFGYSVSNNNEFINYVNELSSFLAEKGLTTRIWNDGLLKDNLSGLDKSVQITYWSYDGNPTDSTTAAERREIRAGMDDLLDNGFEVLNYNWYYLYFVPDDGVTDAQSAAHMASDIQEKWSLGVWDGVNTTNQISDTSNIIGSSFTIWGEDAGNLSDQQIHDWSTQAIAALSSKTASTVWDTSVLPQVTQDLSLDTPINQISSFADSISQLIKLNTIGDVLDTGNTFLWLDGDVGDVLSLDNGWSSSGVSELKNDLSYTLYKNGLNHLYVETDVNVEIIA